ncbi:MAG: proton-conducting transporter membrane subunit [bacterium]
MNQTSILPVLALLIPLLGIIFILWIQRQASQKVNLYTALITLVTSLVVVAMYPFIRDGKVLVNTIETGLPVAFSLRVDTLGFFIGLITSVIWMLSSFFAIEFMSKKHAQIRYDVFSLLTMVGMLGVVFTGDLFSLYILFELLSVASFVLVIHEQTPDAMRGGVVYIFMGISGGLILLLSILMTYSISGTINLSMIGLGLKGSRWLPLIFWGYILGFGVKAGIFPLHYWMPSAYPETPTCAVALSSGVMIKAGAYGIIRAIYSIIGVDILRGNVLVAILLGMALISIFIGSAAAINQTDIKKLLGYSSVSQIGYIILGLTLLSPLGLTGGILHIFNHAIIKAGLFLCAGGFFHQTGRSRLAELKGIGKKMPLVTACFTMAALSMIGLPPFNGFISKWFLAIGALDAVKIGSYGLGVGILAVGTLILSSFMNLIYYGPIVYNAWFGEEEIPNQNEKGQDPKPAMMVPILLLAAGTLIFGLFPGFPLSLARQISLFYFH